MLSLRDVYKSYGPVTVLHGVHMDGLSGEVLAIAGANGAGKSTLIKILSGALARDAGTIHVAGQLAPLTSPREAHARGIRTVHQELSLVPELSVTENILLGALPRAHGLVDWAAAHARASAVLKRAGFDAIDPHTILGRLPVARRQMVEIAKAIAAQPRILILDEPSAILGGDALDQLFALIRSLRDEGVLVLYVSHRLEEVMEIADRVTVIKDGRVVGDSPTTQTSPQEIVRLMAGYQLQQLFPARHPSLGRELLATEGLTRPGAFENVSLKVRAGEIVGMFGLVGSGRTEVAECLFGAAQPSGGVIRIDGRTVAPPRHPKDAIEAGLALVTEDRKETGLVLGMSLRDNGGLATMARVRRWGLLDRSRQRQMVDDYVERLGIRPRGLSRPVSHLSGGNQQKVVLTKWLLTNPRVLILDEPTRGVDVATRVDLYRLIDGLTSTGIGVLFISSDLTEVLGITDRVLVMRQGRIVADLPSSGTDEQTLLAHSIGVAA